MTNLSLFAYPSVLSINNLRVQRDQSCACVFDGELPLDPSLALVCGCGPRLGFFSQKHDVPDAAPFEALSCHAAQFVLCDVQPTAMLGRAVKLKALDKRPGLPGREGVVKGALRVGVEVSQTSMTFPAFAKRVVSSSFISSAQSTLVRRGRTRTCRHPARARRT